MIAFFPSNFHACYFHFPGVNAPLYDQDGGPGLSVHGCVNNWLAGGAKPEQL